MNPTDQTPTPARTERNPWIVPGSIVIAGLLVAGAIFLSNRPTAPVVTKNAATTPQQIVVPAVTSADHILGNPDAKVVMIEYSDTDCPYCQLFMPTLEKIMDQYGKTGQVAWVYRHFTVHPKAPYEAQATECAAELGGNDAFWKYIGLVFSKKDFTQNPYLGLDPGQLPILAASMGLDQAKFKACLDSGKYKDKVANQYKDAIASGGQGTPHTIVVSGSTKIIIEGAQSYDYVKAVIDQLLKS